MGINFLISGDGQPLNWRKCSAFPSSNHVETTLNATQARKSVLIIFALLSSYLRCFDFFHQQKLGGLNVNPAIGLDWIDWRVLVSPKDCSLKEPFLLRFLS